MFVLICFGTPTFESGLVEVRWLVNRQRIARVM